MGNRRIGRKRLYAVEKAGRAINLEAGDGIAHAIKSATQHRQGQEIITEIVVDFAPSSGGALKGGGTDGAIGLGTGTNVYAFLTKLTYAKYGYISEIRAVCLEAFSGGTQDKIQLRSSSNGTLEQGGALGGGTPGPNDVGGVGSDVSVAYTDATTAPNGDDQYLYIANKSGKTGTADYTTGKLVIYIHGFEVPGNL